MKTNWSTWIFRGLVAILVVGVVAALFLGYLVSRNVTLGGFIDPGGRIDLTLPPGFTANVYAEGLNAPRFMAFGPDGVLYAAERNNSRIISMPDANGDGVADEVKVFARDIPTPHSLVYHEGAWYVGVPTGIIRLEDTDGDGVADSREVLVDDYTVGVHSTRTVLFLPDGRMVVSIGSTCNVCVEGDKRNAAIVIYDGAEATNERIFAVGLRNAVGLAINPATGELWATNNGRDLLGDTVPPETVYIVKDATDYGWPYCHAGDVIDPEYGNPTSCDGIEPPVVKLPAHTAPLGLAFYTGTAFPADYKDDLFVALHGSWNSSVPVGYKVVRIPLSGGAPSGPAEDFATGFISSSGDVKGRPVGMAVGADGALYISDDKGGYIYRVVYDGG